MHVCECVHMYDMPYVYECMWYVYSVYACVCVYMCGVNTYVCLSACVYLYVYICVCERENVCISISTKADC